MDRRAKAKKNEREKTSSSVLEGRSLTLKLRSVTKNTLFRDRASKDW